MEELSRVLGFIFMIFTIALKATISNTNSLSLSSFSLGGNKLFSVDTVWRRNVNPVSVFTVPVSSIFVHALPKCVPTDYNSTLPDFTGYKYNIWMPAHDDICTKDESLTSTKGGVAITPARKLKQEKLARLVRKVRQTIFNARTWARLARRVLDALCHWTFAFSVCIGCIREPEVLNALEEIRRALVRLGRKGVRIVCGRHRKTRKSHLFYAYRYKAPYYSHPDHTLDFTKMPLVVHSFVGHGILQDTWRDDIFILLSPVDFLPAYVALTEYFYELRLPLCIDHGQPGAGSRKLGTQWTLRTRKRVCRRITDDEWHIIDATRTEVCQDGYVDMNHTAMEYYRLGPQEI